MRRSFLFVYSEIQSSTFAHNGRWFCYTQEYWRWPNCTYNANIALSGKRAAAYKVNQTLKVAGALLLRMTVCSQQS